MVTKSALNEVVPLTTKDGSTIRELMRPQVRGRRLRKRHMYNRDDYEQSE